MGDELQNFLEDLHEEIHALADADDGGTWTEEAFTERMIEFLGEFGEIDDAVTATYRHRGVKVNGYALSQDGTILDLLVSIYDNRRQPTSFTKTRLTQAKNWGKGFFRATMKGLADRIEEAAGPAFDMMTHIHQMRDSITKVRIFILTDAVARKPELEDEEDDGVYYTYHLWDLERLYRCETSGRKREPIFVDFSELGGPLPVLVHDRSERYTSYLAIMPGQVLADLYERWGARLLERNVRTFLQARTKVNRGIRDSILQDPQMFFTYNNGISATAESADLVEIGSHLRGITSLHDLQIVNGGQTTASIFNTYWREKADLSKVQVQMKLTIVHDPSMMDEMVANISRFSNTQNNVNTADFASNDPFHVTLEKTSRNTWAPDPTGGKDQTRWYYERARGQYNEEKSRQGPRSARRAWERLNPSRQRFTKTDIAKYERAWNQIPWDVAKGAQKNFAYFSIEVQKGMYPEPDAHYLMDLVAKAILFKRTDLEVRRLEQGGYKAQVVAYTVAWLSHLTQKRLDLATIWKRQALSDATLQEILRLAQKVYAHITQPPGGQNVSEWCKREECWDSLRLIHHDLHPDLVKELLPANRHASPATLAEMAEADQSEEYVAQALAVPGEAWDSVAEWATATGSLTPHQRNLCRQMARNTAAGRTPPAHIAQQLVEALAEANRLGFRVEPRTTSRLPS